MRWSIVWSLCSGCGVLGGGKALEGNWDGQCEAEDDNGQDYDYDLSFDLNGLSEGDSEGDGELDGTLLITTSTTAAEEEQEVHAEGAVRSEYDDKEHFIEGNGWAVEIGPVDFDPATDDADWELVGTRDGDFFSGDIDIELPGDITLRGDCALTRS